MKLGKKSIIVLLATVALLLAAAVPALAAPRVDTVDIKVENRTGSSVQLTMNGPGQTERVFVNNQQSLKLAVVPGAYFYKYMACGHLNTGTFTATAGKPTLILKKCGGLATSNIVVDNHTGAPFILTLTGKGGSFGFWIPIGGMNIAVPAGGYHFTSNSCGTGSGKVKASAVNQPLIWKWTCDKVTLTAQ